MTKPSQTIIFRFSIVILIIVVIAMVYSISTQSNLTHIEKTIKKHNSVKSSLQNPKHPTIAKPPSSQIGVIGADIVRVSQ
tara:strand:+ start:252 stop:491 length:240 start_codon:yes stop_codon:yes gene_type:complete